MDFEKGLENWDSFLHRILKEEASGSVFKYAEGDREYDNGLLLVLIQDSL